MGFEGFIFKTIYVKYISHKRIIVTNLPYECWENESDPFLVKPGFEMNLTHKVHWSKVTFFLNHFRKKKTI